MAYQREQTVSGPTAAQLKDRTSIVKAAKSISAQLQSSICNCFTDAIQMHQGAKPSLTQAEHPAFSSGQ